MKQIKKILFLTMVLIFGSIIASPGTLVNAKTKITNKQYQEIMKAYKDILNTNPYKDLEGGGFTAKTFSFKDLDKDGIPELIINSEAPQIFSYNLKDGHVMFIWNSWVYDTMYYSPDTENLMSYYNYNGQKSWSFYKVKNTQENVSWETIEVINYGYSYSDGKNEYASTKGYYKNTFKDDYIETKTTKAKVEAGIEKLVPNKEKLKTSIKNTKANRTKYLTDVKVFKEFTK